VFVVSDNIYTGVLLMILAYIFAALGIILKLSILAAILNLSYVSSLRVSQMGLLGTKE